MKTFSKQCGGVRGGAAPWVVTLVAAGALAGIFFTRKSDPTVAPPPSLAARTPSPIAPIAPLAPATPAVPREIPPVPEAMPEPPPPAVVVAMPAPAPAATPAPLDLATIERTPSLWPLMVALVQSIPFPVVLNGRVVGQAQAKPGTQLRLLRISGEQIEVEFQNARHIIPASATDVLQRGLAKFAHGDASLATSARATAPAMLPPAATPRPAAVPETPPRSGAEPDAAKLARMLAIETIPKKATRVEGGDLYDDKIDRFALKVKFANSDNVLAAEKLTAEIFVFGICVTQRNIEKLLLMESFTFSVPPHGTHELATAEVATGYDNAGTAKYGVQYDGWLLRIRSSSGGLVALKSNVPTLQKNADKFAGMKVDAYYDRSTFKETKAPR